MIGTLAAVAAVSPRWQGLFPIGLVPSTLYMGSLAAFKRRLLSTMANISLPYHILVPHHHVDRATIQAGRTAAQEQLT